MPINAHQALAIAVVFHNQGIILFANGKIVHPNEKMTPETVRAQTAIMSEIAAHALVIEAASGVEDAAARAAIENVAAKAIQAKAEELARK